MEPIGPLMREHRRIERLVSLMQDKAAGFSKGEVNANFLEKAVDFIRTYADRCHHGKEEDILFEELKDKPLSEEHGEILDELIKEHEMARNLTSQLDEAREKFISGEEKAAEVIGETMQMLVALYESHIEKEDENFFHPVMEYFSEEERSEMLERFAKFDGSLIHEKYDKIVDELEGSP